MLRACLKCVVSLVWTLSNRLMGIYMILNDGKFGRDINLVVWQSIKLKYANISLWYNCD
jgi:hypothetical protein